MGANYNYKDPLRRLSRKEYKTLQKISRSQSESASKVARAKAILAVNEGKSYKAAAEAAGRRSNDAVSRLVSRFNEEGLESLYLRHGGGNPILYGELAQKKVIDLVQTQPDCQKEGTATWSLTTLQAQLRKKGLKNISTYSIWKILHESALSWQKKRSWVKTGIAQRERKKGTFLLKDPDTEVKKNS